MREIGAFEAKTHLSELLAAAKAGETVTITRRGQPVARLVPPVSNDRATALLRMVELRSRLAARDVRLGIADILSARDEGRR
ncbi:type II toxin-antitoxin system prevent-host-death family antitoxin [Paracoccus sp. TOH]|uniref:type II toxin-antitoxin system Phd/YefM family antitoxin n=1 Tax=Paracoccus sp. TOH TaxID=1263728 RepID=UPI0025B1F8B8|nr:type II toxin-antitoxin system prevent-host-death family antitoxin [Paracoccus sp. TOH]WJS87425.1 type II toxin-antitoxin system prevent-host-death family antitoxin [Paracoccus sp. TOH]